MDFGGENYNGSFPKLEIRGRVPKKERIYNCCWRKETAAAAVEKKEGEQVLVDEGSQKSEERETLLVKENVIKGSDHDVEETAAAATGDHVEEKTAQVKDEEERESSTQDEESEKSKHEFESSEHTMIKKSDDDDDEKTAQVKDFEDEQEREGRDDESQKSENEHMIKKSHDDDKNEEKTGDDHEIAGDDEQEETDSLSQQLKLLLKLPTNPMIKKSDDPGEERETSVSRERGFGGHVHTCQIFFGTIPAVVHIAPSTPHHHHTHADQPSEFVPESSQPDADIHLLQQAAAITAPTNQVEKEDGDERETVGEEDVKREEEEEVMSFGGKNYEELFPKIEIKARMSKRERRGELLSQRRLNS